MSKINNFNDKLNKIKEKYGNFSREESDFLYDNEYVYSKKDFNNLKSFKESFIGYCACFSEQEFEYFKDDFKYELGEKIGKLINISSAVIELQRKTRCLNNFDKLRDIDFISEEKRKDTYFNVCYKYSHNGNDHKTKEKILKKYIDINFLEGFLVNLSKKEYNEFLMKVEEKRRLKEQE